MTLGANQLTGEIPSELGNLADLEVLNLIGNQLTGEIPASFTGLTELRLLNFLNNAGVCAPIEEGFQTWLHGVNIVRGSSCATADFTDDREVLMAFYNDTGAANRSRLTNWGSNKLMREWSGITTDAHGHVNWLELNTLQLTDVFAP